MSEYDYHVNKYERSHKRQIRTVFIVIALLAVIAGLYLLYRDINDSRVVLQNTRGVLSVVEDTPMRTFENQYFKFVAPEVWQEQRHPQSGSYKAYSYNGSTVKDTARQLEVFVDEQPPGLSFNRAVLVTTFDDPSIMRYVKTSNDCLRYLPDGISNIHEATAVSWENTTFYCNPNDMRNILGTVSSGDGHGILLTNLQGQTRKFLLVYTDHTSRPDDVYFIDIINSFQAL